MKSEQASSEQSGEQTAVCPFCSLPIEPWQKTAEVNGQKLHFDCYREKAGL